MTDRTIKLTSEDDRRKYCQWTLRFDPNVAHTLRKRKSSVTRLSYADLSRKRNVMGTNRHVATGRKNWLVWSYSFSPEHVGLKVWRLRFDRAYDDCDDKEKQCNSFCRAKGKRMYHFEETNRAIGLELRGRLVARRKSERLARGPGWLTLSL